MAFAANDVYQTRLSMSDNGRNISNVFWYRVGVVGSADVLADSINGWFDTNFFPALLPMLHEDTVIDKIETALWRNPEEDYDEFFPNLPGGNVGQGMPPFVTATFRSARPAPSFHYSFKRFGVIGETMQDGGNPAQTGTWDDIKDLLNDVIEFPEATTLAPCQVRHSHKDPETGEIVIDMPEMGEGVNPTIRFLLNQPWTYFVGSQNTRKR